MHALFMACARAPASVFAMPVTRVLTAVCRDALMAAMDGVSVMPARTTLASVTRAGGAHLATRLLANVSSLSQARTQALLSPVSMVLVHLKLMRTQRVPCVVAKSMVCAKMERACATLLGPAILVASGRALQGAVVPTAYAKPMVLANVLPVLVVQIALRLGARRTAHTEESAST